MLASAHSRLFDSKQQADLLQEGLRDCAWMILDRGGYIVSWGEGAASGEHYTHEQVIGRHFSCLYTPEGIEEGAPSRALERAALQGRFEDVGIRVRLDGSRFLAKAIVTAIHDESDALIGFGKIVRELTKDNQEVEDMRASARELRESEQRLRAVVDTAVDGIVVVDSDGIVKLFNPACERLFGYAANEIIGKDVGRLMPLPIGSGYGGQVGVVRESVGTRKDGTSFPMNLSIGEERGEGASNFVCIIHDLTDRKHVDKQLVQAQKMEAVGQLSGGIAHDFNNLLTVIIGNGDTLAEKLKDVPLLGELSAMIVTAGERGAELTRQLLAFSRRQTLQPVAMDCNDHVEAIHQLLRRVLRVNVEIEIVREPLLKRAFADPAQLESVILNLALNARDAMPNGGRLTISTANARLDARYSANHHGVKPGEYVLVSVADNGEGMSPSVRDQAFEPFFTTKEVGKGSGLGLSMVYGFAKQSNGHVSLSSEPGHGTTLRLYLPVASPAEQRITRAAPAAARVSPVGCERVLIVEDDPFVRDYAVSCLEGLGYSVATAADGNAALSALKAGSAPDILFSDVIMPGNVDGFELADAARQILPGLKILIASGYALDALDARGRGGTDFIVLAKPYRKADLAQSMRQALDAAA